MEKIKLFFKTHKRFTRFLTALLINIVLFGFLAICHDYELYINDDKAMQDALSGKYTGVATSQAVFVTQIVCLPLKWLYSLAPAFPFYSVFLFLVNFICCVFICYFLLNLEDKRKAIVSILFYVIMFICILHFNVLNIQFTTAAIFPAALALIMISYKDRPKVYQYFIIALLFILSFSIRASVFELAMIYVGILLIIRIVRNKKFWKPALFVLIAMAVSVGVVKGVDMATIGRSEEYKQYTVYNSLRSDLFDHYGVPAYDEAKELYDELGISEDAVKLYKDHYMIDLEEFDTENLKKVVEYQKQHAASRTPEVIESIKDTLFFNNLNELMFFIILIALIIVFAKRKKTASIISAIMFVVMFVLSFAIAYVMKFPPRVSSCVNYFTIFTFLGVFLNDEYLKPKHSKWAIYVLVLFAFATGVVSLLFSTTINRIQIHYNNEKNEIEQVIAKDTEHLYYTDSSCTTIYTAHVFGKNNRITNVYGSSWHSHSPYQKMFIEKLGYSSLNEMFETAPNLRILVRYKENITDIENYLSKKYNRSCTFAEQYGDIYIYDVV